MDRFCFREDVETVQARYNEYLAMLEDSGNVDESPDPPRPKRRLSSWFMYICSWHFVGEVIFLVFIALVVGTMYRQLFLRPSDYASRQQRYRSGSDGGAPPPEYPLLSKPGSSPPPNYYSILDIDPDASGRELRDAYRRMARKYHPDKTQTSAASAALPNNGDNASDSIKANAAEERFRLVYAAYQTLSNGEDRCLYDYREYPRSEGAQKSHLSSSARLRKYYQCLRQVRGVLFQRAPPNDKEDADDGGDGDHRRNDSVESLVSKDDKGSVEHGNKGEEGVEDTKGGEEVEKKEEQEKNSETAAAKQETAVTETTDPAWRQYLRYAGKAAEGAGEAYHTLCYGDAVARTGLFAVSHAITWRFGMELPDLCLGGA